MKTHLLLLACLIINSASAALPAAPYEGWKHVGAMYLLTTPEGADLPAAAVVEGFPILVRLHKDWFDFSQAQPAGQDLRFSSSTGEPLAYQIEEWEPALGSASIWVRIPTIHGNARQAINMHWGRAEAASESNGKAVFNEANGYLSVWHMQDPVRDEVGTLPSSDTGTSATTGIIGPARHFPGQKGIFSGEKIPNYPAGASPHSSEAWFRAEKPNATILGWGNEGGGRGSKVRMQLRSPPHVHIDSDFSDVDGASALPLRAWVHVAHTYDREDGRLYINGKLDAAAKPLLSIKSPARLWLGGWYNNYDFVGDLDEVRISRVARSADWIKLEYENQQPFQTLVGPLVQPGSEFSVTPAQLTLAEGQRAAFVAHAGGAQKVYWIVKRGVQETVVAADRFAYTFEAGRTSGEQALTLQFKAVFANDVKTKDIPLVIQEAIPDPEFTLAAPAAWDGRTTLEIVPQVANLDVLRAKSAGALNYAWTVDGIAAIKQISPGKLTLLRAQNSGSLRVSVAIDNGGEKVVRSCTIAVQEPAHDAWTQRTPAKDEKPADNQFYARDDKNEGTLYYNGVMNEAAEAVFLKVYADDQLFKTEIQKLAADKTYAFTVKLRPGLIKYRVEFGSQNGGKEAVLQRAANLVCGDAYLIDGQSNAVAADWGAGEHPEGSDWIRSFGSMNGDVSQGWVNAVRRHGAGEIGYWGMDLAQQLVESEKIPICIINGAVGGTLIEAHQRNAAQPTDPETIYGRLLNRVERARLTHGIRGVFWHQGENNQGTQGATGRYGWETYESYFVDVAAAWKTDFPNIQHYYIFQIWPNSCAMGGNRASDKLRDVQRTLPRLYSNMSVMSTLGIKPPGSCHYPPEGYAEMARLILPLVERDNYGRVFERSITPPNVKRAYYTNEKQAEVALEFDQPMAWNDGLISEFYLDGQPGQVARGAADGNVVTLQLASARGAKTISYLVDKKWDAKNLLFGTNQIAALTFCEVPLAAAPKP